MPEQAIAVPPGLTTDGLLPRRYLARAIDSIAILAVLFGVFFALGAIVPKEGNPVLATVLTMGLYLVIWIGYGALLESSQWQATLGKRVAGLKVYSAGAGRITFSQALRRNLVKDGPFFLMAPLPGGQLLCILWLGAHLLVMHRSSAYQAIHDRVAHTWVAAPEQTISLRLT
jgi:uncharacterized RDD family membrane protein YckC